MAAVTLCARCRSAAVERVRRLRQERMAAGLCFACGLKAPARGRKECSDCLAVKREKNANRRKALGLITHRR